MPPVAEGYTQLKDGDLSVWIPEGMEFSGNIVRVEQTGFLWAANLEVMSATSMKRGGCGG